MVSPHELNQLIQTDLYASTGLTAVMGESREKGNDIPAYQEQLLYLRNAIDSWPIEHYRDPLSHLTGNRVLVNSNKILVLTEYCHAAMPHQFFWLTQTFPHAIQNESGVFILMFNIEHQGDQSHIFPEWFTLFAFENNRKTFYSQIAFHSVLTHSQWAEFDWHEIALTRALEYGLPTQTQLDKLKNQDLIGAAGSVGSVPKI